MNKYYLIYYTTIHNQTFTKEVHDELSAIYYAEALALRDDVVEVYRETIERKFYKTLDK